MSSQLVERWVRWWWADLVVLALATCICSWVVKPGTGVDLLGQLRLADRRAVYTDMLQLATIFAGLGGVVFAIFIGLQSQSIREIKERVGEQLLRIWISALLAPWLSAFLIILAKVVDRGGLASNNVARWLAVAATTLVALQLVRILWVFYQLATIETAGHVPAIATSSKPAVVRSARDVRRRQGEQVP